VNPQQDNPSDALPVFPHQVDRESHALLQHIHPNVYLWAEYEENIAQYLNGYFVQESSATPGILIDPPLYDEYLEAAFEALGGVSGVCLTNTRQIDKAKKAADALGVPLFMATERAPEFLGSISLEHQSTPEEAVLFWPEQNILFTGFTFHAPQFGMLALHPEASYLNVNWVHAGLNPMKPIIPEVRTVLPSVGEPIIHHAGIPELLRSITNMHPSL
jgi:hypothetical protein